MENKIGKQLGSGGTSNVYEWGNDEVIKIYKAHVRDDVINGEVYISQILNKYELNIPKFIKFIEFKGNKSIVYERINGNVMAELILQGDNQTPLAHKFAQLHYEIHNNIIDELPSQYEFLKNSIISLKEILGDQTASLLETLESIPLNNKLCHGDFQPMNIIGDGSRFSTIDWNGACSGNPIFDVAWSYMTLKSPVIKHVLKEASELIAKFGDDYLLFYCELSDIQQDEIIKCIPIVAARRLYDNSSDENEISQIEKDWLVQLIHKEE